jgi:uncharacterized protein (DUF488 family)
MQSQRQPIRTIGHGTRTTSELVSLLRAAGVQTVIDVRRYPHGRRQPQFAMERLMIELPAHGLAYEAWSDELGGRRPKPAASFVSKWTTPGFAAFSAYTEQPEFRAALSRLEERADGGEAIVLMCAETLWWKCHRRLISDELVRDGFRVVHLIDSTPGVLHPSPRSEYGS